MKAAFLTEGGFRHFWANVFVDDGLQPGSSEPRSRRFTPKTYDRNTSMSRSVDTLNPYRFGQASSTTTSCSVVLASTSEGPQNAGWSGP
ncbi:hypothetical protein APED_28490 [Acanthopleuribacter pedis]